MRAGRGARERVVFVCARRMHSRGDERKLFTFISTVLYDKREKDTLMYFSKNQVFINACSF